MSSSRSVAEPGELPRAAPPPSHHPRTSTPPTFAQLCAPGLTALRTYFRPFILIQILALAVLLLFFSLPDFRHLCERLARLKDDIGLPAVAISAAIAGGLLPEFAKLATGTSLRPLKQRLQDVAFDCAYFAFAGTSVHLFYQVQSHLFGDDPTLLTVIKKVAFDEFGFTVLWASPCGLIAYTLKSSRFSLRATLPQITPLKILYRLPEILIPCWAFWIPMTAMIYSLPATSLQYLLFSLALGAWALLLTFIATPSSSRTATAV